MFNLLKTKKQALVEDNQNTLIAEPIKEITNKYPSIVDEIHNEFFTAGDKILLEAKKILEESAKKDLQKGKRLASLGFVNTIEAVTAKNIETDISISKELAETVAYFNQKYPFNKFITEKQITSICEKYNLVFGDISAYTGFVPEKKICEIEKFKIKPEDYIETRSYGFSWYTKSEWDKKYPTNDGIIRNSEWNACNEKSKKEGILKICAPLKDMKLTSRQRVVNHRIENIPDPIVLKEVTGGYLIVTAWGDEASDELVVNQKMN